MGKGEQSKQDIPPLLPLEYCTVERAARLLGCEVEDIHHWHEIGAIQLCVNLGDVWQAPDSQADGVVSEYIKKAKLHGETIEVSSLIQNVFASSRNDSTQCVVAHFEGRYLFDLDSDFFSKGLTFPPKMSSLNVIGKWGRFIMRQNTIVDRDLLIKNRANFYPFKGFAFGFWAVTDLDNYLWGDGELLELAPVVFDEQRMDLKKLYSNYSNNSLLSDDLKFYLETVMSISKTIESETAIDYEKLSSLRISSLVVHHDLIKSSKLYVLRPDLEKLNAVINGNDILETRYNNATVEERVSKERQSNIDIRDELNELERRASAPRRYINQSLSRLSAFSASYSIKDYPFLEGISPELLGEFSTEIKVSDWDKNRVKKAKAIAEKLFKAMENCNSHGLTVWDDEWMKGGKDGVKSAPFTAETLLNHLTGK